MIDVVQVGTGHWGTSWAREVLPAVATVRVTGYVDTDPAALAALRAAVGVPAAKCFASLRAALAAVPCDAVLAPLRIDAHFPVVAEALAAGKHVLVEKPFASTLDEAATLVRLAAERGRLLMVSQNYRFFPVPFAVRERLAAGTLGTVDSVAVDFRRHAPTIGFRYYDFPDPLVADMSIHHYDLMRFLFGEVDAVSCRSWKVGHSAFRDDPAAVTTVALASGVVASYRASFMASGESTPWGGEWAVNCAGGELRFAYRDDAGKRADWLQMRRLRGAAESVALPPRRHQDRAGAIAAFAEAVATGEVPDYLPVAADNIRSLAVVKACVLSARNGGAWVRPSELLGRAMDAADRAIGTGGGST